jgi:hypothetical protein
MGQRKARWSHFTITYNAVPWGSQLSPQAPKFAIAWPCSRLPECQNPFAALHRPVQQNPVFRSPRRNFFIAQDDEHREVELSLIRLSVSAQISELRMARR